MFFKKFFVGVLILFGLGYSCAQADEITTPDALVSLVQSDFTGAEWIDKESLPFAHSEDLYLMGH